MVSLLSILTNKLHDKEHQCSASICYPPPPSDWLSNNEAATARDSASRRAFPDAESLAKKQRLNC